MNREAPFFRTGSRHLFPTRFALILEGFGALDQLEEWMREGALELKGWEETTGEGRRRTDTD